MAKNRGTVKKRRTNARKGGRPGALTRYSKNFLPYELNNINLDSNPLHQIYAAESPIDMFNTIKERHLGFVKTIGNTPIIYADDNHYLPNQTLQLMASNMIEGHDGRQMSESFTVVYDSIMNIKNIVKQMAEAAIKTNPPGESLPLNSNNPAVIAAKAKWAIVCAYSDGNELMNKVMANGVAEKIEAHWDQDWLGIQKIIMGEYWSYWPKKVKKAAILIAEENPNGLSIYNPPSDSEIEIVSNMLNHNFPNNTSSELESATATETSTNARKNIIKTLNEEKKFRLGRYATLGEIDPALTAAGLIPLTVNEIKARKFLPPLITGGKYKRTRRNKRKGTRRN
jgi:hypothetical protein